MSESIVVLRKYVNEFDARLDATILEANGIPAQVLADTAGGTLPSIALVFPVRLLVRAEDATLAADLLGSSAAADGPGETDPSPVD